MKLLQKNVDEAVEKLRTRGIEVLGVVCHVSNAQQRKNLIDKTVQVRNGKRILIFLPITTKRYLTIRILESVRLASAQR